MQYEYSSGYIVYSLATWVISAVGLWLTAKVMPGIEVKSFGVAFIAAAVIAATNVFIRPILFFLTLPINILTLGLFTFVVNGMVLKITAYFISDFIITSWFSAIIGAIVLAVINYILRSALL
jgi:putative membrane protein